MNPRHADLIAKVNAGAMTADQAKQYSETLSPLRDPGDSQPWRCGCGQCLPKSDAEVIYEANRAAAVNLAKGLWPQVQLTEKQKDIIRTINDLPLPIHHADFEFTAKRLTDEAGNEASPATGTGYQTNEMGSGGLPEPGAPYPATNDTDMFIAAYAKQMDMALKLVQWFTELQCKYPGVAFTSDSTLVEAYKAACEFLNQELKVG